MRRIQRQAYSGNNHLTPQAAVLKPQCLIRNLAKGNYDRESVVSAAVDIFNLYGFDATSMGLVADILEVTRGALYHHVSSKGELLRLALSPLLAELDCIPGSTDTRPGSSLQQLQIDYQKVLAIVIDNLPAATLLLQLRGNTPRERELLQHYHDVEEHLSRLIVNAMVEGSLSSDIDAQAATQYLLGLIRSITDWLTPDRPAKLQLIEQIMVMAFLGLKTSTKAPLDGEH